MSGTSVKRVRLSRRTVLRGLGAGIALPLLDAMLDDRGLLFGEAHAAPTPAPVRLLTFFFPMGWGNVDPAANFMNTIKTGVLAPYAADFVAVTGLNKGPQYGDDSSGRGDAHASGHATFATGYGPIRGGGGGVSVDQLAAQKLGTATRFKSLAVGIGRQATEPYWDYISWQGAASPLPAEHDPVRLFETLFGAATTTPKGPDYRRNVLDYARSDLTRLNARLGAADRARIDLHLTAIAEVQQQLLANQSSCETPAEPAANLAQVSNERAQAVMRLWVLALQCDLTRYGSMKLCSRVDSREFPWIGVTGTAGPDGERGHHGMSHDASAAGESRMQKIIADQAAQFAFLLKLMKAAPEAGGTLLDNSIVFFASEHMRSFAHSTDNLPVILAGKAGGKLKTGRIVAANNAPYANTFVTMLNYAGIPTTSFGKYGVAPLSGV